MYFKLVDDQYQNYSIEQLRIDNPQVSFPENPSAALLAEYSVFPFTVEDQPPYDQMTQRTIESGFVQTASGNWVISWSIENIPLDTAASNARNRRDQLLSETDWIVVKYNEIGESIPVDWSSYRQSLRDITLQEGFPYAIVWPIKP